MTCLQPSGAYGGGVTVPQPRDSITAGGTADRAGNADPAGLTQVGCELCGTPAPSNPPPLSWVVGVERGQRVWHCDSCARAHLRSIEAGLDSSYW